jgi:GDP-L-fucose synthase
MDKADKIFVAGHNGLIGSALVRQLRSKGYCNLLLADHADLELTNSGAVDVFFDKYSPDYVLLAAGKVGGIIENQAYPAEFMNTNLAIQLNVLKAAHHTDVRKLILFASSCMYPRECQQPMVETALLSGHPEPTSLAYAISKLTGMQMCLAYNQQYGEQRFIPVIPNSVFGPNDNFDPESGHVLSALISRFHKAQLTGAQSLTLWGSGSPRREFVHADDVAAACIALLVGNTSMLRLPLNLGSGKDLSICELAQTVARVIGYTGTIVWDTNKPDGAPRKLLDSSRMRAFGWQPRVNFEDGLKDTYRWYLDKTLSPKACS